MPSAVASMGYAAALGMGAADPVTEAYEFTECDLGADTNVMELIGARGTRARIDDRVRLVSRAISGGIKLQPTAADLRNLFPRILGGAEGGAGPYTYAVAEALPSFYVHIDRVAKTMLYDGVKVDTATFSGTQGGVLELTLALEGMGETVRNSGTFPAISPDCTDGPWVFREGVFTVNNTAIYVRDFQLTVNNALRKDRFYNSITRISLPETDREITYNLTVPWNTDTTALYDVPDTALQTNTLVFTHGTKVLTITLGNLRFPSKKSLPVRGKQEEIVLGLTGQARRTCAGTPADIAATIALS